MKNLVLVLAVSTSMAFAGSGAVDEPAALAARRLAREASSQALAADPAARVAKFTEAVALMPEHPRYWLGLAAAHTAAGQAGRAMKALGRIADMGNFFDLAPLEPLAPLREREDFRTLVARMAGLREPAGRGEVAFELPGMSGLVESIAWCGKTGECFFGDVHLGAVWRRGPDGVVSKFAPGDSGQRLFGVFGLEIDEPRGSLWAALSAVPEMRGFVPELKGRAGIAELDLATGAVRRVLMVRADNSEHVLGDLLVAEDGAVFATDSAEPVIWRLAPGGDALERWVGSPEFLSLQGLAFSHDGSALVVAAYGNGLLRVDLATREVMRLPAPIGTTLLGVDGIERCADGALIAVQNGIDPARIVRVEITEDARAIRAVSVLESGHAALADPTLVCRSGGEMLVVGDAGWRFFEAGKGGESAPRAVPIMRVLPGATPARP